MAEYGWIRQNTAEYGGIRLNTAVISLINKRLYGNKQSIGNGKETDKSEYTSATSDNNRDNNIVMEAAGTVETMEL